MERSSEVKQVCETPIKAAIEILQSIDWGDGPLCNPHLPRLYPSSKEWLQRTGLRATEKEQHRHESMDIPYFASLAYPMASEEGLLLAHNWLSWVLVYDDTLDEGIDGVNLAKIEQSRENFLKIFRGGPADLSDPLSIALDDIWQQIVALSDNFGRQRFFHSTLHYLKAVEWEARNRLRSSFPSEEEYLQWRLKTSAAQPCIDLMRLILKINLTENIGYNEEISYLETLTNEIITLSNDLISFPNEEASNEIHNIVLLRAAMQKVQPEAVLTQVAELLSRRIDEFRLISNDILEESPSEDCKNYVKALEASYVGTLTWYVNSGRYSRPC